MAKYVARFNTTAEVSVTVEVPDEVDELDREDWAADHAHSLASEYVQTWGVHPPVFLGLDLDGVGADTVEPVDQ